MPFCIDCGAAIPESAKFCSACGKHVISQAVELKRQERAPPTSASQARATDDSYRTPAPMDATQMSGQADWPLWAAVAIVFGVIAINTVISSYEGTAPISNAVAAGMGTSLVAILFGGLIGFFVGRGAKKKQPIAGFISGTIIVFFLELFGGYDRLHATYEEKQQTAKAVTAIKEDIRRELTSPTASSTAPPPVAGDLGEMQKFLRLEVEQFQTLQRDYMQELGNVGWKTILDAERIRKDVGLHDSKRMIAQAKRIVEKYTQKTQTSLQGLEAQIQTLPVSDQTRGEALAGFRKSLATNNPIIEIWQLEAQTVAQFDAIITLLESSPEWIVKDNQVLFKYDFDLARFNGAIASIDRLTKQEAALRQKAQAEVQSRLDSLAQDVAQ